MNVCSQNTEQHPQDWYQHTNNNTDLISDSLKRAGCHLATTSIGGYY